MNEDLDMSAARARLLGIEGMLVALISALPEEGRRKAISTFLQTTECATSALLAHPFPDVELLLFDQTCKRLLAELSEPRPPAGFPC